MGNDYIIRNGKLYSKIEGKKCCYLLDILSLSDPFISDFDSWVAQTLNQVGRVHAHQICDFVSICLDNEDIVT